MENKMQNSMMKWFEQIQTAQDKFKLSSNALSNVQRQQSTEKTMADQLQAFAYNRLMAAIDQERQVKDADAEYEYLKGQTWGIVLGGAADAASTYYKASQQRKVTEAKLDYYNSGGSSVSNIGMDIDNIFQPAINFDNSSNAIGLQPTRGREDTSMLNWWKE
jgi:hypothetical protein